jgi:hypothetical protein
MNGSTKSSSRSLFLLIVAVIVVMLLSFGRFAKNDAPASPFRGCVTEGELMGNECERHQKHVWNVRRRPTEPLRDDVVCLYKRVHISGRAEEIATQTRTHVRSGRARSADVDEGSFQSPQFGPFGAFLPPRDAPALSSTRGIAIDGRSRGKATFGFSGERPTVPFPIAANSKSLDSTHSGRDHET